MPYVTSVERLARREGFKQGVQQGIVQGLQAGIEQCARDLLPQTGQIRFGQIPDSLRASIHACTSTEQLTELHRHALLAQSLDGLPSRI